MFCNSRVIALGQSTKFTIIISNNFITRFVISVLLALPADFFLFSIRNLGLENMTLYGYVEYTLFVVLCFFLLFEGHQLKSILLERKISWKERFKLRLISELIFILLYTPIITTGCYYILYVHVWDLQLWVPSIILYAGLGFFISTIFMGFVNASFVINYWKQSLVRSENLEKENIRAHLESLQSQLSPHFLFNNFNILDALIEDNPTLARKYVLKMSEVFRYILDVKDSEIVSIDRELLFVRDYIFLINIRFGNNVILNINIDRDSKKLNLPPASLQLLIENAIKHNEISNRAPLKIEIFNEKDLLIVQNSKMPKKTSINGTGTGLRNLRERYKYLSSKSIDVEDTSNSFIVKIPLLEISQLS